MPFLLLLAIEMHKMGNASLKEMTMMKQKTGWMENCENRTMEIV